MDDEYTFFPPRRAGLISLPVAAGLLTLAGAAGIWQATRASLGPVFLLYLLPSLVFLGLVPMLAYRFLSLRRSSYHLQRDGLSLRWGLRAEDIPMDTVEWLRPAGELAFHLPLPWPRWPGAILGVRRLPGGKPVEFLASETRSLLVLSTAEKLYAISPQDPGEFLAAFRELTEMGSLAPVAARSVHPSFLLFRVWGDRPARYLLLGGLFLSLVLLVWVILVVPGRENVHFGFHPDGTPGDLVPAVQLLLLPVMEAFFYTGDLLLGLFFYRLDQGPLATYQHPLAYLLWGTGMLTALFFLVAVALITRLG